MPHRPSHDHLIRTLTKNVVVLGLVGAVWPLAGCHRSKTYETSVEVTRIGSLRRDEQGNPITMDVEISYLACPGTQVEVIRGGKDFASCLAEKVKTGDKIKVKLEHHWSPEGHYDFHVFEVAGCSRPPDPNDEASYKVVRECADWKENGARVGFQCSYTNNADLEKACPWFERR